MPTPTYIQIHKTVLSSGQSSINFTTIDSTYTDLRIIFNPRITSNGFGLGMRFNNDSSQLYHFRQNRALNGGVSITDKENMVFASVATQSRNTGLDNLCIIDIFDYNSSSIFKTYMSQAAMEPSNSGSSTDLVVGIYRSLSPITRIDFAECGDGGNGTFAYSNLQTGSSVTIYGIKAGT
jgi:hypothetical protein